MSFMDEADISGTLVPITGGPGAGGLEAITRGEIDIQIATAKAYPRSITSFKRTAMELATLDEETAGSMFYVLKRGGKKIEGPSVRMAEVVAYSWGNMRVDARIAAVEESFLRAVGTAFDLERNLAVRSETQRRITDRDGKRYNDDMIGTTSNAACSIAFREAVFKAVPRSLFMDVYEQARLTSVGKAMSIGQKRTNAIEWFAKAGVPADRVLASLGVRGIDDLTVDHLITLVGIKTAIKDGEVSVEQAFPLGEGEVTEKASAASERLRRTAQERPAAAAAAQRQTAPPSAPVSPARDHAPPPPPDDVPPPAETGSEGAADDEGAAADAPPLARYLLLIHDTMPDNRRPVAGGDERDRLVRIAEMVLRPHGSQADFDKLRALAGAPKLSAVQATLLVSRGEEVAHSLGVDLDAPPAPAAQPARPAPELF